ncbi:MAG TPA: HEPN domain-containing protein, partial [bacterium]|nr:HEPN domain-containing protein [bacterium]
MRAQDWLEQAKLDLRHARNARDDQDYNWSCFAAQQAAE